MKGNNSDDLMATDGPSSDSSTELVSAFENGKKAHKRSSHKKMERVDSGSRRRQPTESSSSGAAQQTGRNSLTPPRQASQTLAPQKTRSKAKAMEGTETSGWETGRLAASSHSPRRSAPSTFSRSGSGNIVRDRSRDLSVDAATRRSRERSIDAAYRRAHQRSFSKDRSTEAQNSTTGPSSQSPRSNRQSAILDSVESAIQRRAGRKPDPLSSSRHGDPSANQKLGSSMHGGRRRASVPESLNTSKDGETIAPQNNKDELHIRRAHSDGHRKPYIENLENSSHRRPTRRDPLGGSRHGPHSASSHGHRSRSLEPRTAAAESRGVATAGNQRRAAKKDDALGRSRHREPTSHGLNVSSHTQRSRSGERRKQVADSLGMVSQRRAARKEDLLGGSIHEGNSESRSVGRRSTGGGTALPPTTPSSTVKPNVDCFKNLSRLLSDSTFSPNKTTDNSQVDNNNNSHDNVLMDLLTTDLTPKQLRRALRARQKGEEAKNSKQQQEQQEQQQDDDDDDGKDKDKDKQRDSVDSSELESACIMLDPSTSFEQCQTSRDVEEHPTNNTEQFHQAMNFGFSVDADDFSADKLPSSNETTTTTIIAPRQRQFRRHTMDHAPKHHDPEPPLPAFPRASHYSRSTSVGALEPEDDAQRQNRTGNQVSTKRRFGKRGEVQLEAMKRDRNSRKQSIKESILSILDE